MTTAKALRHELFVCVLCAFAVLLFFGSPDAHGQNTKEISHHAQFWGSLNTTARVTEQYGVVADFHIRRDDFIQDPSFYFVRFGPSFWVTDRFTVTFGYAHMWKAPAQDDWDTWTNENRVYEQFQYPSKFSSVSLLHRLRNEQRWQQQVRKTTSLPASGASPTVSGILPVSRFPFPKTRVSPRLCYRTKFLYSSVQGS